MTDAGVVHTNDHSGKEYLLNMLSAVVMQRRTKTDVKGSASWDKMVAVFDFSLSMSIWTQCGPNIAEIWSLVTSGQL